MVSKRQVLLMGVASIHFSTSGFTVNIARGKPTAMSTMYKSSYSSFAVDRNTSDDSAADGCAHADTNDWEPWWLVDLLGMYLIHNITVTNRDTAPERLHGFVIEIFSQNPNGCVRAVPGVCYNYTGSGLPVGHTALVCDQPMWGRFVRVRKWQVKSTIDVLTLCEVEIYSSDDGCSSPRYFRRKTGTRLLSEHSELSNDTSLTECADKCRVKVNCLAFNFNVNNLHCEIISSSSFNNTMESRSDWDYYGLDAC